jgi:hypothetical protein
MPSAVVANNFRPPAIRSLPDGIGKRVPEGGPPAAGIELVVCFVERRVAALAGIDAGFRVVLVEWAGAGVFGALLAKNAELLWAILAYARGVVWVKGDVPGDSCVCHSPSGFCTG